MGAALALKYIQKEEMQFFVNDVISKEKIIESFCKQYRHAETIEGCPPTLGDINNELYPSYFWETLVLRAMSGEDLTHYSLNPYQIKECKKNGTLDKYLAEAEETFDYNLGYGIGTELEMQMAYDIKILLDEAGIFYFDRLDTSDVICNQINNSDIPVEFNVVNSPLCEVW